MGQKSAYEVDDDPITSTSTGGRIIAFDNHMRLVRHIIFIVCILTVATSACLHGRQHFSTPQSELSRVLFWALVFLTAVGVLGFITQFFARHTGQVMAAIFFGFLAGIMATNFISEVDSGTTYSSFSGYLASYGLMLLFFGLAVVGLVLFQKDELPNQIAGR